MSWGWKQAQLSWEEESRRVFGQRQHGVEDFRAWAWSHGVCFIFYPSKCARVFVPHIDFSAQAARGGTTAGDTGPRWSGCLLPSAGKEAELHLWEGGGGVCLRAPWITSAPVRANWITTIPVQRSFTQTPAWTFVVHWNTASQIQQQQQMCTNHYDQHSYNCSWHGYTVTFSCFYQICFKSDLLKAWNINALCLSGIKEKTVVKSGWI